MTTRNVGRAMSTFGLVSAARPTSAGGQVNMLSERYTGEDLSRYLLSKEQWRPFPTIDEREPWEAVPGHVQRGLVEAAEDVTSSDWPVITAADYMVPIPKTTSAAPMARDGVWLSELGVPLPGAGGRQMDSGGRGAAERRGDRAVERGAGLRPAIQWASEVTPLGCSDGASHSHGGSRPRSLATVARSLWASARFGPATDAAGNGDSTRDATSRSAEGDPG